MVGPSELGQFIATCRKEKNLTQKQLGEVLGVTDRAVSKWENGKSFPDISLIEPLCKVLDISISEFMLGKRIEPEKYQEETEKAWMATLDEPLLYKMQMIIYVIQIAAVLVFQVPFLTHGPLYVGIICSCVWLALCFVAYYLDKKIPERNLRYSNPWIEGVFSVLYYLSVMLYSILHIEEWKTWSLDDKMLIFGMIIGGAVVVLFVRVCAAGRKKRRAI